MEIKIGNAVIGKVDDVKLWDKGRTLGVDPAQLGKDFSTWACFTGKETFVFDFTRQVKCKCPVCGKLDCKEHVAVKQDCLRLKEE
jgi:hypothetical protein